MAQPVTPIGRREELYTRIVSAIRQLPEDLREVFVRTHYGGEDPDAIAGRLGVTEGQLACRRVAATAAFFANLEGRRFTLVRCGQGAVSGDC